MSTAASPVASIPLRRDRRPPARRAGARAGAWRSAAAAWAIVAAAGVLRLVSLAHTPRDAFYDAAVRSMGESWHAFFVGALDPSARVAIDKPPLDLWLQVASTKVLGFTSLALHLPSALAGTITVALLYDLVRTLAGRRAGLCAAAALAVLPVAVITSRSDTMDSVMAALVVGALAITARAARDGRASRLLLAGALIGLAFEVKLFEALLALVPLGVLWWLGAPLPRRARARGLLDVAGAAAVAGLAWLAIVTLAVPAADRPWAYGSTNGSVWDATFVYDGLRRLTGGVVAGHATAAQLARVPAAAGPLRLLSARAHLGARIGIELAAAWAGVAAVAVSGAWRALDRLGRAGAAALLAWLAVGTVLFSAQGDLRPRYLEAFDAAVAGCLGLAVALLVARFVPRPRPAAAVTAVALVALLAVPAAVSIRAVAQHAEDAGSPGSLPAARLTALTAYLRAHQGGATYEAASVSVGEAASVIAHDGRPLLVLTGAPGRPIATAPALARDAARGAVRTVLLDPACARSAAACTPAAGWARAHGTDVSAAAGQPLGSVYAVR